MVVDTLRLSEKTGWLGQPRTRRVSIVLVPESLIIGLLKSSESWDVAASSIPDDARVIGIEYSLMADGFLVYLESPSFDEVQEGVMPPMLPRLLLRKGG